MKESVMSGAEGINGIAEEGVAYVYDDRQSPFLTQTMQSNSLQIQ